MQACAGDYAQYYLPELEQKKQQRQEEGAKRHRKEMDKLQADMAKASVAQSGGQAASGGAMDVAAAAIGRSREAGAAVGSRAAGVAGGADEEEEEEEEEGSVDYVLSDESIEGSEDEAMERK